MQEIWKDIEGYEGLYQISNLGRVKSLKRKRYLQSAIIKERILKFGKDGYGYSLVTLCRSGKYIKRHTKYVHRLVWDAFGIQKRNGHKLQIDHIDNDKTNNKIDNLQLLTSRQNVSKGIKLKNREYPTGVYKNGNVCRYRAMIWINRKHIYLGSCKTPEAAALLYQEALIELMN